MRRWWEEYPDRYQQEIRDLEDAGIHYERDEDAFSRGKLVLYVRFPTEGGLLDLTIKYPDTYPFFRPKVLAPKLRLPYHQNPDDKNLCLLDQPTDAWNPEETAFSLLSHQLPKVLVAGGCKKEAERAATVAEIETHQAEPRSAFYRHEPGSVLLIDGAWKLDGAGDRGLFVIGFDSNTDPTSSITQCLRGAVLELQTEAGSVFEKASEGVRRFYSAHPMKGHWVRLPTAPDIINAEDLLQFVKANCPKEARFFENRISKGGSGVLGFVFPEERQWRGEQGFGWLFLTFQGRKKGKSFRAYLTRGERSGPADLRERIPELRLLADKKVVVVGCGCVGAPSAAEFAKCGLGELRLWDGDSVSPGNVCRWPLGVPYTGWPKVEALTSFLSAHYPQTGLGLRVPFKLGEPDADEAGAIKKVLDGVDLIFDATAERGVQLFLSSVARTIGKPYVMAESRPGGWGGIVSRFRPDKDSGCYYCLLHSLTDGSIPSPPSKEEDFVQPQGCISPTFTASSFDTSTISLAAVRLAVSTLLEGQEGGYPAIEHDVGVLSLRDPSSGLATFPVWTTYPLHPHPKCHWHG